MAKEEKINWYNFNPTKNGLVGDNRLIFLSFKPKNIDLLDNCFEDNYITYFFPLFIHFVNNDFCLCKNKMRSYLKSVLNKEDIPIKGNCKLCASVNEDISHVKKINKEIKEYLSDKKENLVLKKKYVSNIKNLDTLKDKIYSNIVYEYYLFLVINYAKLVENKDDRVIELQWCIGERDILNSLAHASRLTYQFWSLLDARVFWITKSLVDPNDPKFEITIEKDRPYFTQEEKKFIMNKHLNMMLCLSKEMKFI